MLTHDQMGQIRQRLEDSAQQLRQNAQSSLRMTRDRETDTGRDSIDVSVSEEMLSTDLRLRDREQKLLGKILQALRRLEEGTIDECEECGENIGFKRLLARPVTTMCIHCKESHEEKERQVGAGPPPRVDRII